MYWNPYNSNSIENLLDRDETTLETLLGIDNVICQVRSGDARLITLYRKEKCRLS